MSKPKRPSWPRSLLIVDDSVVQRQHAVALCRTLGIEMIYEAGGGDEALELLAMLVLPPDLLIIDLEMPEMDGIELIQQLKLRGIDIPLIVASARESVLIQAVELMGRNLGLRVIAGLQKPLDAGAIAAACARLELPSGNPQRDGPGAENPPEVLGRAIEGGQIQVHYQPKVDMQTGIVRGMEALARWNSPELGSVRPDRFIAVAEREGLIHALTVSVLEQALAQAADWNAHGLRLSMAVNLSPCLLVQPQLVENICARVAAHGLKTEQIVLEITESSVVDCMGAALGVLSRLRLKGLGLSIDDYGTGFSSMQQLARIPFTELKIDRTFVHRAHERCNHRVILQSALDMAQRLGLVTVAEGIETLEDWRLLQEFGCKLGQGFLLAQPMPAGALPRWLKTHQTRLQRLRPAAETSPSLESAR